MNYLRSSTNGITYLKPYLNHPNAYEKSIPVFLTDDVIVLFLNCTIALPKRELAISRKSFSGKECFPVYTDHT